MVTTKLNLSMTEPSVRQIYAKQGDTGRVLDIALGQTPEYGTLRILRPDGVEVASEAVTGGEVESGSSFESLTEADVTELTAEIEPVQDLNGYDKPWVGGAGKNLLPITISSQTYNGITLTVNADGSIKVSGTASALTIFILTSSLALSDGTYVINGCPSGGGSSTYRLDVNDGSIGQDAGGSATFNVSGGTGIRNVRLRIASGCTVSNLVFWPMIRIAGLSNTFEPYENICPITGHDEVTVTRTGKNLLPNIRTGSVTYNGITYTVNDDKSITVRGTATALSYFTISATSLNINRTPLFKANIPIYTKVRRGLHTRYTDGTYGWIQPNVPYSPPKDISLVYIQYTSGETVDETVYPMVTYASETDDSYEPYQGSTYTTSLGQTVYGGTLDMVTGVLTVDKAISVYQGGSDEGWTTRTTSSGYTLFEFYLSNVSVGIPASQVGLCNEFAWNRDLTENIRYRIVNSTLTVRYDGLSLADWKAFLASNPMQVVYPLATPLTYTLTPQQIKTLIGTNNVWASSGDIVSIKFTYGGLLSELPSDATSVVGKCYCDVEQNGVSSMPFTLNVKKNERES